MTRTQTVRRLVGATSLALVVVAGLLVGAAAAVPTQAASSAAPQLTVSKTNDIAAAGEYVDVTGSGYNTADGYGVYVTYCAVPKPGLAPTPCGATPGQGGSGSAWVTAGGYGAESTAIAYGPGGTFTVQVFVSPTIGELDCRKVQCAVVTRMDHRKIADRSQDVIVPTSITGTDVRTLPLASADPSTDAGSVPVSAKINPVATNAKPKLPVTVRSADGRTVEVTDVARIVSLNGSLSELMYTLGLGRHLVGRDITATFSEAKKVPLVTRGHDVSAESVLSTRPTLVLAQTDSGPPDALEHIRDAGVPVLVFEQPKSIDGIGEREVAVAKALGVPKEGEKLRARTRAELDEIQEKVPENAKQPKIAFLYMRGGAGVYLIGGAGSGADSMITAAGGIDAGTAMGLTKPFTPITSEALVKAAPDVILMTTTGLESVGGLDGLVKIPGIAQTPAGKQRRVITEEDGLLFGFGSRTPVALNRLVEKLYPTQSSGS